MAFRDDLTIDWTASPRIIEVPVTSTELLVQDLYDTVRTLEERPDEGLPYPIIVGALPSESGGKQDLGSGINVGVTVTLIDAQVRFADRAGPTAVQVFLNGGNVVRSGGLDPIATSAFTHPVINNQVGGVIAGVGTPDEVAAAVADYELWPGFAIARVFRIMAAATAGPTGVPGGPGSFTARSLPDDEDMITGTADLSGDRSVSGYGT